MLYKSANYSQAGLGGLIYIIIDLLPVELGPGAEQSKGEEYALKQITSLKAGSHTRLFSAYLIGT